MEFIFTKPVVSDVAQVTMLVRSCCLPFTVPVAVYCWVVGALTVKVAGITLMEVKPVIVTVMVVEPVTVPAEAVMVDCPGDTPVTNPELLIVAIVVAELLQKRPDETVLELPSL